MSITAIVICSIAAFESLIILIANSFTVFVFWTHRSKLKRTSFLLINLAVADLLVGFTEPIAIGTVAIPQRFEEQDNNGNISTAFQATFASASVFCLVVISLERAFALIWPFRHRATSTATYICGVAIVWAAGTTVGMLTLLAVYSIVNFVNWIVAYCCIIALSLLIICASYLSIRRKLTCRLNPAMDTAHNDNRQSPEEHNTKLSRTLFIMIAASLGFWLPSTVLFSVHVLCNKCLPINLIYTSTMLHSANSLVNPIIYSFRMPMFREALRRVRLRKRSKEYAVHYQP